MKPKNPDIKIYANMHNVLFSIYINRTIQMKL